MDIRVYRVKYIDGNKESVYVNTIVENIFSQVDEESDIFMLFDEIVDHHVDGTETMYLGALIVSNNEGKRIMENENTGKF